MIALTAALLAGCADDEQLGTPEVPETVAEAQPTAQTQPALTPEQQLMKQNLDAAAQLLVGALNKPMVQRELQQLDYLKTQIEAISFTQLLRNPAKDSRFRSLATELGRSLNAGAKGSNNLADYLIEQGCGLYMPVPLEYYEPGTPIAVVGDPIADVDENIGYVFDAINGVQHAVLVNEEYVEKNPILVVTQPLRLMPSDGRDSGMEELMPDPDWGGGGGGWTPPAPTPTPSASGDIVGDEDFPEDRAGKICKIEIGAVHLARKPKLWSSTVLRVGRGNSDSPSAQFNTFSIPWNVARAASNGWTQHGDGGWVDKDAPVAWDSRWYCKYVDQVLYSYIERGDEKFTVSLSVKYKDYVNIQIGMKEVKYENAVVEAIYAGVEVCQHPLNRTSFIRSLMNPSYTRVSPKTGEVWPVVSFGDLTMTMRVVWV